MKTPSAKNPSKKSPKILAKEGKDLPNKMTQAVKGVRVVNVPSSPEKVESQAVDFDIDTARERLAKAAYYVGRSH